MKEKESHKMYVYGNISHEINYMTKATVIIICEVKIVDDTKLSYCFKSKLMLQVGQAK